MTEIPDEELVRAAQRGSAEAVATLFERHWRDAWRLAATVTRSPHDADDAAQQAFVRAIARIRRLRDPRRFRPWLHRIVLSETRDERRRRSRETLVDPPADRAFEHDADDPGPAVEALAGLDHDRRAVVVLRHCSATRWRRPPRCWASPSGRCSRAPPGDSPRCARAWR